MLSDESFNIDVEIFCNTLLLHRIYLSRYNISIEQIYTTQPQCSIKYEIMVLSLLIVFVVTVQF